MRHIKWLWGAVATVFVWALGLTYVAGERARQMDVNTEAIRILNERGTPGMPERFTAVDYRLGDIDRKLEMIQEQLIQVQKNLK